jgi:hypothetical protein
LSVIAHHSRRRRQQFQFGPLLNYGTISTIKRLNQQRFASGTVRRQILLLLGILVSIAIFTGIAAVWRQDREARHLPFLIDSDPVIGNKVHSVTSTTKPSGRRLQDFELDGDEVIVAPDVSREVRQILAAPSTYRYSISDCFEPGMALSFGNGPNRVDVVICLLCNRVIFYQADQQVVRHLSDQGNRRLAEIYKKLFGTEPPPF